jgi:hypothetical protein
MEDLRVTIDVGPNAPSVNAARSVSGFVRKLSETRNEPDF